MKKLIYFLTVLTVLFSQITSCKENKKNDEEQIPTLSVVVKNGEQELTNTATLNNFSATLKAVITTTYQWNVSTDKSDMVIFSKNTGTGDGEIDISITPNNGTVDRSAKVTFKVAGAEDVVFTINQSYNNSMLGVDPKALEFTYNDAPKTITLTTNMDWETTIAETDHWITIDKTSSTDKTNATLSISVEQNDCGDREGKIIFKGNLNGNLRTDTLTVVQKSGAMITIDPDTLEMGLEGEAKSITLNTNLDWTATIAETDNWIILDKNSGGKESATISVTVAENIGAKREGKVIFTGTSGTCLSKEVTLTVTQLGGDIFDITGIDNTKPIAFRGVRDSIIISITSNMDWSVTKPDWITVTPDAGVNAPVSTTSVKIVAAYNGTSANRNGKIIFTATKGLTTVSKTFDVNQIDPVNDEASLYPNGTAIPLSYEMEHPSQKGWKFYTAHEFNVGNWVGGTSFFPTGFWAHSTKPVQNKQAISLTYQDPISGNYCATNTSDGILELKCLNASRTGGVNTTVTFTDAEEDPNAKFDGIAGKREWVSPAYYSHRQGQPQKWCNFTENMRIEIRFKSTNSKGFNDALWLMSQTNNNSPVGTNYSWPKCGEIDILELPRATNNARRAHQTLHSENFSSVNGKAVTQATDLDDASKWHIYWIEILPNKIRFGINGKVTKEHTKTGPYTGNDWPWSKDFSGTGFYFIVTSSPDGYGSGVPAPWSSSANPSTYDNNNPHTLYIDWIRVYTNSTFVPTDAGNSADVGTGANNKKFW